MPLIGPVLCASVAPAGALLWIVMRPYSQGLRPGLTTIAPLGLELTSQVDGVRPVGARDIDGLVSVNAGSLRSSSGRTAKGRGFSD